MTVSYLLEAVQYTLVGVLIGAALRPQLDKIHRRPYRKGHRRDQYGNTRP